MMTTLLLTLSLAAGAPGPAVADAPGFVPNGSPAELADVANLARLRAPGVSPRVFLGPVGAATAGGARVLAEASGPGVLQSVWVVKGEGGHGRLRVVLDGGEGPGFEVGLGELAEGRDPRFPRPLAGAAGDGVFLFVPHWFARSLRVEFDGPAPRHSRVSVATGSVAAAPSGEAGPGLTDLAQAWSDPPDGRTSQGRGSEPAEYPVELAARASVTFLLPPGPRTVRRLEVVPDRGTDDAWRSARLRLTWESDGPEGAGVDVPLGMLVGRPPGGGATAPPPVGEAGREWVARFPMPYRDRGVLQLDTDRPLSGRVRVVTDRGADPGSGYFRGAGWAVRGPGAGDEGPPVMVRGRGHIVGLVVEADPGQDEACRAGLGRLVLDGMPVGRLDRALGLPEGPAGQAGPVLGVVAVAEGGGGPARGKAPGLAVYRWLAADPLPYHRAAEVQGPTPEGRVGGPPVARETAVGRAAVFWYSDRPGAEPGPGGR